MNFTDQFAEIFDAAKARQSLARAQEQSLAKIIADLLNENESLLQAEADGNEIIVRERGGFLAFCVTVDTEDQPQ